MNFIDAHCHLADPRVFPRAHEYIHRARQLNVQTFLQAGVDPQDWARQKILHQQEPGVWLCFGLHPYFIADHDLPTCEAAIDVLGQMLPQALALGECGLDFRPHIMKDSFDRQIDFFERQLELAKVAHKPVVLHLVRAFDKAVQVLELFGLPQRGGFVHAFNGSRHEVESYLNLGLLISIGGAVCRADNQRLHQAVQALPLESLLLESDTPDQAPPGVAPDLHGPASIIQVAEAIEKIKKIPSLEILDKSSQNLRKLLAV